MYNKLINKYVFYPYAMMKGKLHRNVCKTFDYILSPAWEYPL